MGRRGAPELYRAPFPLYAVSVPRADLVVTAGGGGASKTGISNGLHFLRLECVTGDLSATLVHAHDTETRATMNMAVAGDILAVGQDATCHILRFQEGKEKPAGNKPGTKEDKSEAEIALHSGNSSVKKTEARKRKTGNKMAGDASGSLRNETPEMVVESLHVVRTDFSTDALQKTVRFNMKHSFLITGGVDGFVRVWEFPSMKKCFDFRAHDGEVEDVDISPDNKLGCILPITPNPYPQQLQFITVFDPGIVTVGRDFKCCVWKNDQLVTDLRWNENMPHISDKMYRYQACRFGKVEDDKDTFRLYTVQIPHKRERKPLQCYISKWDGKNFLPLLTSDCGNEVISAMSVSDLGTFIGLGTVTGSVAIYIAFSLQRVYYVKETHGIVVTDLAFLPDVDPMKEVTGKNEAALLSVAVDSRCKVHLLPRRQMFPIWVVLLLCGLIIVLTIVLLQHLFPGLF
ncbi:prolactin regulatory element-binding protein isoform X2 [Stegostoma tigrinum]|uniref:prolactin regulatory element-binding protein isoform X2 n=1 Tax=Stegostoma tigrinum TaxID=3053191 RepID=UPI00202B5642|nr:prolactin regulatory element-binding protein isoform X2 [Stegostoma tigrinum]